MTAHPEFEESLKDLPEHPTVDQVLEALPTHKFDGALLPYDTWIHWGFALVSGVAYLGLVLLLFPTGHAKLWQLLATSVFTGTVGILLLLAFQWIAFHFGFFVPRGIIGVLLDIVAFIGWSYRVALEPDSGFLLSALGFTAGVGFCEEACKALPLIWVARTRGFYTWRSAMIWGLVSGVGFGVSEAITYSHDYYNGIQGAQIYLVRFISCVALHGIWAAATGINIFRRQDYFRSQLHPLEWILQVLITVIVPMCLHGMYDTLLKQQYDWGALLVALASFGWLAWQIELAKRKLDRLAINAE
jgi:RsiW-degrading membrane proteinase PrsW (M82 family)